MTYPNTRKVEQTDTYHGVVVEDPYRWLEDDNSPETAAWVASQNETTFAYLRSIPFRDQLRDRLTRVWNYPRFDAPYGRGNRYFFFKNDGLQNQAVLYMQEGLDGEPEIILDPNTFSSDGTVALSILEISGDGSLIGYGVSRSGSDWAELRVRDVASRSDLPDDIRWVKFSNFEWTKDNGGFFYSRYPRPVEGSEYRDAYLNQALYYHRLGTDQSEDILIYERPDFPTWLFGGMVTHDGRYLVIAVHETGPANLLFYKDLRDPMNPVFDAPVVPLVEEFEASYEPVGNDGPVLYLLTDHEAPRKQVIAMNMESGEVRTLIPEGEDVFEEVLVVGDRIVIICLHNAYNRIALYNLLGEYLNDLPLPTLGSVINARGLRDAREIFYAFTSFLYPTTIFRFDPVSGENEIYRTPAIDFDRSVYETSQIWYTSDDGTRVPMFVTHKKGLVLDGSNPTLLYGYGGFNNALTPFFSIPTLLWIENGGVFVVANLRGGGEFGEEWHRAGVKERKQNGFDDFIAAAEYLIDRGYTSPARLALQGASNGGLLVGAVMCQRPDLFAVALPAVGVMDMLRYHKFTIGMAWRADYGLSDDPSMFMVLHRYSPLHNLKPGTSYPATLVTTADHDDRVVPAHSFKFAARLQECQAGPAPTLIRVETKAGHGSGKPIAMIIEETADVVAFAMFNMATGPVDS
jgi:prolyl oligopeptidase